MAVCRQRTVTARRARLARTVGNGRLLASAKDESRKYPYHYHGYAGSEPKIAVGGVTESRASRGERAGVCGCADRSVEVGALDPDRWTTDDQANDDQPSARDTGRGKDAQADAQGDEPNAGRAAKTSDCQPECGTRRA